MVDRLTEEHRSWLMSRVRSKDTGPEMRVRSAVHKLGLRFRLYRKELPGKPDLVLKRHMIALFVHGCFWHQHRRCRFAMIPKSRTAFWRKKFLANSARDIKVRKELQKLGWRVVVIWECETRGDQLQKILVSRIRSPAHTSITLHNSRRKCANRILD